MIMTKLSWVKAEYFKNQQRTTMFQLHKLALAIVACLLCVNALCAVESDLLNDPEIAKTFKEDAIEIVKIEKILADINITKNKKGYTVIMAKARMPKVENLGASELKNAYNPWLTFGFCVYAQKETDNLHTLFVILNNKNKLDAIVYERNIKVSLDTKVHLAIHSSKNYYSVADLTERAVFVLISEGCGTNRYFFFNEGGNGIKAHYGMILMPEVFLGED
jgi:hypothetical protein